MTAADPLDQLAAAEARSRDLSIELEQHRALGMAVGMVVERLRLDVDKAEGLLRALADTSGRDLHDIARELVTTGRLSD